MESEAKARTKFNISPSLFWTIASAIVSAAFGLGYYFGVSKFDEEKIRCFLEREKLKSELSVSRDSIAVLKDSISHLCQCTDTANVYNVFDGHFNSGLDVGLATSGGQSGWLQVANGEIRMDYPSGQNWGAMFITEGKSVPLSKRKGKDFSKFKTLTLELKGSEGSVVEIGLKDSRDPDTGLETKIPLTLKKDWTIYKISLDKFKTADLKNLYVITEFVFAEKAQTVYARKIQFTE
jgi:hypothetical protein